MENTEFTFTQQLLGTEGDAIVYNGDTYHPAQWLITTDYGINGTVEHYCQSYTIATPHENMEFRKVGQYGFITDGELDENGNPLPMWTLAHSLFLFDGEVSTQYQTTIATVMGVHTTETNLVAEETM